MIALVGLILIGGWVWLALRISKPIKEWIGKYKYGNVLQNIVFPVLLILPLMDEIIGQLQFTRLCEREAVTWLNPDWEKVKRAKKVETQFSPVSGHLIPIRVQRVEYVDADTGKTLLSYKAFHTKGGLLFGRLGLGMEQTRSCWPKDDDLLMKKIDIDRLLNQGR